ncbi:MAG: hypothetical protein AAF652_14340 [Cyanobacteria bacterium P01_C01_bin.72]
MSNQSQAEIAFIPHAKGKILKSPKNLPSNQEETVEIRELDPKYTRANRKKARCTIPGCDNPATHWLTRINANYCQSDMVCHHHATIWMTVRYLIS